MKQILFVALTVIMTFNLSESTPATLCRWTFCGSPNNCHYIYTLKIRNGFSDATTMNRCISGGKFCISSNSGDTILAYNDSIRRIRGNQWRRDGVDAWCRELERNAEVFWLDL